MKKGLFISAEGTDGSGKTTQINRIRDYFQAAGREIILTREPGGTRISEEIRTLILNPEHTEMGFAAEMLLYAAARAQLVAQVIKPALNAGKVVICDRFVDSTYAYQGFGRGIDLKTLETVNNIAIDGVLPDITFFFDICPETALQRRKAASTTDRLENEKMDFHRKVYEGYVKLAERSPERIKVIDSSRSVEEIWENVKAWLDRF